jgi:hypothetical protein
VTAAGRELAGLLVDSLDSEALDRLADALAPRLAERLELDRQDGDGWLDTAGAARHLGMTANALHKLRASGNGPPSHQDVPGGKRWYRRSDLDQWRAS